MRRRFLFYTAAVTAPILLFVIVELGLRVASFSYPLSFFQTVAGKDGPLIRDNPLFFYRFFPPKLARSTGRFVFPRHKAEGVYRIFIFGSSAAMGDPDFSFSFSRMLERMLAAAHPHKRFEVINTAATAVNSHVILPIAQECSRKEPDVFIVFMGNNEVIGPYGPGTVLMPWRNAYRLIRLSVALKGTKWGQLADAVRQRLRKTPQLQSWGGLELFLAHKFRADDPKLAAVYRFFAANLRAICRTAERRGIPLVLCTIPTNLAEWAPFLSLPAELSAETAAEKQKLTALADQAAAEGESQKALSLYAKAAALDSSDADLMYALARCNIAAGNLQEARSLIVRARDLDALRFRADSRLNDIIRRCAAESGALMADLAALFLDGQLTRRYGDLFLDHVHFTINGNYLIAKTLLPMVETSLNLPEGQALTLEETVRSLAYTGWDALRIHSETAERFSHPPFTTKRDAQLIAEKIRAKLQSMQPLNSASALAVAKMWYEEAIDRYPTDWVLSENYGKFLLNGMDDPVAAEECFRRVLEQLPNDALTYNNLGAAQSRQGNWQAAEGSFRQALRLMPHLSEAAVNRLQALIELGKTNEAERLLPKTDLSPRRRAELLNSLGIRFARSGAADKALSCFLQAEQSDPSFGEAFFNAGLSLRAMGDAAAALAELGRAVQLVPDQPQVRRELAKTLVTVGRYEDAIAQYKELLRIKPQDEEAGNDLGVLYGQMGLMNEALTEFNAVLSRNPENMAALSNSAMTASLLGRHTQAIDRLKVLNRLHPRPETLYRIGLEFLKLDRPDSARNYFQQAFDLQSDFMPAVEKLDSLNRVESSN